VYEKLKMVQDWARPIA